VRAMKAGAADFLEKPVRSNELIASIVRASERSQDAAQRSAWRQTAVDRVAGLTPREREVMDLVVQGRPNKIIADVLGISQRTVENHRAAVMKRMDATTLADLIRLVMAANDGQPVEA
jgi:two-component system, chemotaxis family, CheB/CheR fusion protein